MRHFWGHSWARIWVSFLWLDILGEDIASRVWRYIGRFNRVSVIDSTEILTNLPWGAHTERLLRLTTLEASLEGVEGSCELVAGACNESCFVGAAIQLPRYVKTRREMSMRVYSNVVCSRYSAREWEVKAKADRASWRCVRVDADVSRKNWQNSNQKKPLISSVLLS